MSRNNDCSKVIEQRNKMRDIQQNYKEKNKQLEEKNKKLEEKNKKLEEKNKQLVVNNKIFKQKIYVDNNVYFETVESDIVYMFKTLVDNETRNMTPLIKITSFIQKLIKKNILFLDKVKQKIYDLIRTKYGIDKDKLIKRVQTQINNHLLKIYRSCKKPIILGCSKDHDCIELRF